MTQADEWVEFEEAVGRIEAYDPDTQRARIRLERGDLRAGELIEILGARDGPADVITIGDLLADDPADPASMGRVVEVHVPRPVSDLDDVFLARTPTATGELVGS